MKGILSPAEYDERLISISLRKMLGDEVYFLYGTSRDKITPISEILGTEPRQIAREMREEHEEILRRKILHYNKE